MLINLSLFFSCSSVFYYRALSQGLRRVGGKLFFFPTRCWRQRGMWVNSVEDRNGLCYAHTPCCLKNKQLQHSTGRGREVCGGRSHVHFSGATFLRPSIGSIFVNIIRNMHLLQGGTSPATKVGFLHADAPGSHQLCEHASVSLFAVRDLEGWAFTCLRLA